MGTIPYEMTCGVSQRVRRVVVSDRSPIYTK
jgi:alanine racemase